MRLEFIIISDLIPKVNALKESASPIKALEMAAGNDITVEAASALTACVKAKQDLNKFNLSANELKDEECVRLQLVLLF